MVFQILPSPFLVRTDAHSNRQHNTPHSPCHDRVTADSFDSTGPGAWDRALLPRAGHFPANSADSNLNFARCENSACGCSLFLSPSKHQPSPSVERQTACRRSRPRPQPPRKSSTRSSVTPLRCFDCRGFVAELRAESCERVVRVYAWGLDRVPPDRGAAERGNQRRRHQQAQGGPCLSLPYLPFAVCRSRVAVSVDWLVMVPLAVWSRHCGKRAPAPAPRAAEHQRLQRW